MTRDEAPAAIRGEEAAAYGAAPAGGEPDGLPAHVCLSAGPAPDQRGTGRAGGHEPRADCQAGGLLGGEHSAGGALPGLAVRFRSRGPGHFAALPPAGDPGGGPAAAKFPVADGGGLGVVRCAGPGSGRDRGGLPGQAAGQAHPGLLPADLQHPRLLAGPAASDDLFGLAGGAAHRSVRPHRNGRRRRDPGRPATPRRSARPHPQHHRRGRHRPAHSGKDVRCYGVGLCPLCPGAGGEQGRHRPAARPAERGPARPHPAIRLHQ